MSKWKSPTDKETSLITSRGVDPKLAVVVNRVDEDSFVALVLKTGQELYIKHPPKK